MRAFLLDTHVVLWLLLGDRGAVSPVATEALTDSNNSLYVSAVTYWEIAIKRSLGKLPIGDAWAKELSSLDLNPQPVNSEHAQLVEHLPWHHRDPFDRLLVAQAKVERQALITADDALGRYQVEIVW